MYYHAHVYWSTPEQRAIALSLREPLSNAGAGLGRVWDTPIGPHPLPMYQVNYCDDIKNIVENWLEGEGLNVLLHEDTGDDLRDHTEGARWIGQELKLDLEWLAEYVRNHNA
jgi:aromatic ring-cleaving dioxygenase